MLVQLNDTEKALAESLAMTVIEREFLVAALSEN